MTFLSFTFCRSPSLFSLYFLLFKKNMTNWWHHWEKGWKEIERNENTDESKNSFEKMLVDEPLFHATIQSCQKWERIFNRIIFHFIFFIPFSLFSLFHPFIYSRIFSIFCTFSLSFYKAGKYLLLSHAVNEKRKKFK